MAQSVDGDVRLFVGFDDSGIQKGVKNVEKSFTGLTGVLKKIAGLVAVAFAVKAVVEFVKESNAAYKLQMENEIKLATVMRQRMKSTDASINSVLKLTAAEQKLGVIGDEVQIAGAQQLATFLKNEDALKVLIPAMNNLNAQQNGYNATAESSVGIANMMGKVLEGQVGALKRVGISFSAAEEAALKNGNEMERAATLAQVITNNVGNMNQALAQTDVGRQKQLSNTFADIKEQFGKAFSQIGAVFLPVLQAVANGFSIVANYARQAAQWISIAFGGKVQEVKAAEAQSIAIGTSTSNQQELAEATKETNKEAKKQLATFDEISIIGEQTAANAEAQDSAAALGGFSSGGPIGIETQVDTSQVEGFVSTIKNVFDGLKKWFDGNLGNIFEGIAKEAKKNLDKTVSIFRKSFDTLKTFLPNLKIWFDKDFTSLLTTTTELGGKIFNGIWDSANLVFGDITNTILPAFVGTFTNSILPIYTNLTEQLVSTGGVLFDTVKGLFDKIYSEGVSPAIGLITTIWSEMWDSLASFWDKWGTPIFEGIKTAIQSTGEFLESIWTSVIKPVWDAFMSTIDWLWTDHIKPFLDSFLDFIGELINAALLIYNNVIAPIVKWLVEILGPIFASVFKGILGVVSTIFAAIIDVAKGVINFFKGIIQFFVGIFTSDWKKAWEGIKNIFKGIWDAFYGIVKFPINLIIDGLNALMTGVASLASGIINTVIGGINLLLKAILLPFNLLIDGLNLIPFVNIPKLSIEIPGVPDFGGLVPTIPKLATGTVVPPNREFLAVLGDNTKEHEIVAPESAIKAMVKEAMAELGVSKDRQAVPVILMLDRRELGRAVVEVGEEEAKRVGTRLVMA